MQFDFLKKISISISGSQDIYPPHSVLLNTLGIIDNYFKNNNSNKLCLIFPVKGFLAQWISVILALEFIKTDFLNFKKESTEFYKKFQIGDFLKLNNKAIVKWLGYNDKEIIFKTAEEPPNGSAIFKVPFTVAELLQPAGKKVTKLSKSSKIKSTINTKYNHPTDNLLDIYSGGNFNFLKTSVCLINKINIFSNFFDNITLSDYAISDYFNEAKLDEKGEINLTSPLIVSKNLINFVMHLNNPNNINFLVIDGFSNIFDHSTEFSDIQSKNISTVLISDLSELESFEYIRNYGFDFFNFNNEYLELSSHSVASPFFTFNSKLNNYINFKIIKEICHNKDLEVIVHKMHSIENDDSNKDLNTLKINLIQLTNYISRICYIPSADELNTINQKFNTIDNLFQRSRMWLGNSYEPIGESIVLFKTVINNLTTQPSDKCTRLKSIMSKHFYDYIICPTENEAQSLKNSLTIKTQTKVITIADVNDNLIKNQPVKAIITGWTNSHYISRIQSSFLFSDLTFLFYQYENNYYGSLQRRNRKYINNITTSISNNGAYLTDDTAKSIGFNALYFDDVSVQETSDNSFDILEYELKLEDELYSRYMAKGNLIDSIKGKRINFDNDLFIYSSESHKYLVINELIEKQENKAIIRRIKIDTLKPGDIIALINTDRDILVELVDKITNKQDLAVVKHWAELWKKLLREYYVTNDNDFNKLVKELRNNGCKKHKVTIRTWLQDENRIGPNDDSDLINIALMTNSQELLDNISKVRNAISKMVGWRMQAADFISNQIKSQIHKIINESLLNSKIEVEGLGSVTIIKVNNISNIWEDIDIRYINKLLQREKF